jgi:4-hydroxy-3-polyprenylbenzoate decarboxylase
MPRLGGIILPEHFPIVLGVTGASGQLYAVRAVTALLQAGYAVELVASKAVSQVWQAEHATRIPSDPEQQRHFWLEEAHLNSEFLAGSLVCHRWSDLGATIASGSFRTSGMVVIPCSMATLAKLAAGLSSDLLERAADVHLKEGRPLVVVPRETPFSLIHLRNLTTLAEAGVRIVPAIPAWYHHPKTILDLVDFVVARALDQLGIETHLIQRWQGGTPIHQSPLEEDAHDRLG